MTIELRWVAFNLVKDVYFTLAPEEHLERNKSRRGLVGRVIGLRGGDATYHHSANKGRTNLFDAAGCGRECLCLTKVVRGVIREAFESGGNGVMRLCTERRRTSRGAVRVKRAHGSSVLTMAVLKRRGTKQMSDAKLSSRRKYIGPVTDILCTPVLNEPIAALQAKRARRFLRDYCARASSNSEFCLSHAKQA